MPVPLQVGQLAVSKAGRDAGHAFIIIGIDGDRYVRVADGRGRTGKRPKVKNVRHLQVHRQVDDGIARQLQAGKLVADEILQQVLQAMLKEAEDRTSTGKGETDDRG
ncbi:MAG: KOW domain-containing RNA-binding protein [Thermaerobacterales bacterium]